eukprot:gene19806-23723_t
MSPSIPIPDFQDEALNTTKNEILDLIEKTKIKYDPSFIGGVNAYIPVFVDFGSILSYSKSDKTNILRAIKNNLANILKQGDSALQKMDAINKGNVQQFITRIVVTNVAGKASTSKKSSFYPDGTLEIGTVFEDGINCAYYLEKKIVQALNEFRPAAGAVVPEKVAAFEPVPVQAAPVAAAKPSTPSYSPQSPATSSSQPAAQAPVAVSTSPASATIDLSQPNYPNGAWETLKLEILALCKPLMADVATLGAQFEMPVFIDWGSLALSGADPQNVLRSIKNNYAGIMKQVLPGIAKVDAVRKPMIRDYLVSIVLQNVAGKASTAKRAFLAAEGTLVIVVPFEDSINCSYYIEKKITSGLNEFYPPTGGSAPTKFVSAAPVSAPVEVVAAPIVAKPSTPSYGIPDTYKPVAAQPYVPVYAPQPVVAPVAVPIAAPAPVVIEPPKDKGRPEMDTKPSIEDAAQQFLLREINAIISSFTVTDDRDQPIGAPIYLDWASIMVYPTAVKQATILRNVNLSLFKLLRESTAAIRLACTDFALRDNVIAYLRSVTVQNIQGTSTGNKKVIYEDGHLIIQTIYEDFGNCGLYFDTKIVQALQTRPSVPTPKKPEAIVITKEEVAVRLNAHKALANRDGVSIAPSCAIEMDWSFMTVKANEGTGIENNIIGISAAILADLFTAIQSFTPAEIAILRREMTKIVFAQAAPGKTMFDKRTVTMNDAGLLTITSTFEDRTEGAKTFKDKFVNCLRARLFKVEIRDVRVPSIKALIDTAVRTQARANPLDKIVVPSDAAYSCSVIFDWQLVDKEPLENQVKVYQSIVSNLGDAAWACAMLKYAISDVCSYDAGKIAFLPTTSFVLRQIMKVKEEVLKLNGKTWEFFIGFHDTASVKNTKQSMTVFIKEQLSVAFSCAVQDTFPQIQHLTNMVGSAAGKTVPIVINYDSFRNDPEVTSKTYSYTHVEDIVVKMPTRGLSAIGQLCGDKIVAKNYSDKVNKIVIEYDMKNSTKRMRKPDVDVLARLDSAGVLTFTVNYNDAKTGTTHPWAYQVELILNTRPQKVARSIENAKASLVEVSKEMTTLIGRQVEVSVNYASFIQHNAYIVDLEEASYTKIIASFARLLSAGWLQHEPSALLASYATVKSSLAQQLSSIVFSIDCTNGQREAYQFVLNGTTLNVSINLTTAIASETKQWRIEMERVFKLRDLKIKEEIAKRIDLATNKAALSKIVGKPVDVVIDWTSIENDATFSKNMDDYIAFLHRIGEEIPAELATDYGLIRLCQYAEVQSTIQNNLSTVRVIAGGDGLTVRHVASSKTLELVVGVRNVAKFIHDCEGNFEEYGRKIERAMDLRLQIVRGQIKRKESAVLAETASRIAEGVEQTVTVKFDWEAIVQHPGFLAVTDHHQLIDRFLAVPAQLHPIIQLCRENPSAKKHLAMVRNYTILVDGANKVNEAEFGENKFGVDWAKCKFMSPPAKDHILITINIQGLNNRPYPLGLEEKIEFLVTPDLAEERYQKKLARQDREEDLAHRRQQAAKDDAWRSEQ